MLKNVANNPRKETTKIFYELSNSFSAEKSF